MLVDNYLDIIDDLYANHLSHKGVDLESAAQSESYSHSYGFFGSRNRHSYLAHTEAFKSKLIRSVENYLSKQSFSISVPFLDKHLVINYRVYVTRQKDTGDETQMNYDQALEKLLKMAGIVEVPKNSIFKSKFNLKFTMTEFDKPKFFEHNNIVDDIISGSNRLLWENSIANISAIEFMNDEQIEDVHKLHTIVTILEHLYNSIVDDEHKFNVIRRDLEEKHAKEIVAKLNEDFAKIGPWNSNSYEVDDQRLTDILPLKTEIAIAKEEETASIIDCDLEDHMELVEGTYDENQNEHLKKQIWDYIQRVTFSYDDYVAGEELESAISKKRKIYELIITDDSGQNFTERLQCAKQFLRLCNLVINKLWYAEDEAAIGQLHADGTFVKNDKLLEIIKKLGTKRSLNKKDLQYVLNLYKDRSYVVGCLKKVEEDRPAPESLEPMDGYSEFA